MEVALLKAAKVRRPSKPATVRSRASGERSTTAIPPLPLVVCINLDLATIRRAASSRSKTPATCAAATSPMLCPTTAAGSTPHERQSAASAT